MPTLIWQAPMSYHSPGDEAAFFGWLQSIPGVMRVEGRGRELLIHLRSRRLSNTTLRELVALYERYGGNMPELASFAASANVPWLASASPWYKAIFARKVMSNNALEGGRAKMRRAAQRGR